MARSSSGKAKPDGMRRRSPDANPEFLTPRKNGSRLKSELKNFRAKKAGQSHRKRP